MAILKFLAFQYFMSSGTKRIMKKSLLIKLHKQKLFITKTAHLPKNVCLFLFHQSDGKSDELILIQLGSLSFMMKILK